jgi:hypothetical protein
MIKHIVFFKHERFEELKDELVDKLKSLKQNIEYIIDLEVGIDFMKSERSFNACLLVVLDNKDDLAKYAKDPAHLPVIDWIKSNGFEAKVVDYEVF